MPLDQKTGALLTLGFAGAVPRRHSYAFITKYHCGGLRLSAGSRSFGNGVDPQSAKSVVVTFVTSSGNIEAVPGSLFGKIIPKGLWPVSCHA